MSTEESILERLNLLEKQNRWMKRIAVAVIVIAASLPLMAQKPAVNRTVEANEFILRDSNGNVGSKWSMTKVGPRLSFQDAQGKERIVLVCNAAATGIWLGGSDGASMELSGYGPTPSTVGPSIFLSHGGGSVLVTAQNGEGFLSIEDKAGFQTSIGNWDSVKDRTGKTHHPSAASVLLFDKDKQVLWQAPEENQTTPADRPGDALYTPTKLEWATLELNAIASVTSWSSENPVMMSFFPGADGRTIVCLLQYTPNTPALTVKLGRDTEQKAFDSVVQSHGWPRLRLEFQEKVLPFPTRDQLLGKPLGK